MGRVIALIARIVVSLIAVPLALIVVFRFVPVPITPLMVIRLIQGQPLRHQWVAYEHIAPALPHALVASEDKNFFHEGGVDPRGTLRAFVRDLQGQGYLQGGSTITQQYVALAYTG